jgi:hypothetical protein
MKLPIEPKTADKTGERDIFMPWIVGLFRELLDKSATKLHARLETDLAPETAKLVQNFMLRHCNTHNIENINIWIFCLLIIVLEHVKVSIENREELDDSLLR